MMKNSFVTLLFLLLAFSGVAQVVGYDVFGIETNPQKAPYLLTLDTLNQAKTLNDINARYKSSWVASYLSVELSSTCGGVVKKAVGTDDKLTDQQLDILKMADFGCRIDVIVDYIPQNTLKDNPPRKMNFALTVIPIIEAKYPGGYHHLKTYLKENILDKIDNATVEQVALARVRFYINEEGQASDPEIFLTSDHEQIDQLILQAIDNMPTWSPAKDANGKIISQGFEFTLGTTLLRCDYEY